jgi:hypothetical protein
MFKFIGRVIMFVFIASAVIAYLIISGKFDMLF